MWSVCTYNIHYDKNFYYYIGDTGNDSGRGKHTHSTV